MISLPIVPFIIAGIIILIIAIGFIIFYLCKKETNCATRFSFNSFITHIFSRKFIAWATTTVLSFILLLRDGDHEFLNYVVVCECIATCIYILGNSAEEAILKMIERSNINLGR